MSDWPRYHVAGDRGSDGATGLDPGSPLKTLGKALEKVHAWGGAAEILLRDCLLTEHVVIGEGGVTVRGLGAAFGGGSSKVKAPGKAFHCIEIAAPDCQLERLTTVGADGRWTGVGYRLRDGCQNAHLTDCWHIGAPKTVRDATSGGTALMSSDNEGAKVDGFRFANCRRGVRQGHESTGLHLTNVKGTGATCEALVTDGEPTGGLKVFGWKSTHCGTHNDGLVAYLGPDPKVSPGGQGVYVGFDADEGGSKRVEIHSRLNTFIGGCSAPGTEFHVHGELNGFQGFKIIGTMRVYGRKNQFTRLGMAGNLVFEQGAMDNIVARPIENPGGIYGPAEAWSWG